MELKTAVVLVGGKALRMRPLTEEVPKCMVEVSKKPLLYWILTWLKLNGIMRVVLGVAYKKELVMDYVKNNPFGLDIACNDHSVAEDTGDAIRLAIENQNVNDDVFLVMNGDELTDVSLSNFLTFHRSSNSVATLLSCPLRSNFGVIAIDGDNHVREFKEKPIFENHFMNAGVYIFTQAIRPYLPQKGSVEKHTFVKLAQDGKLKAFKYFGFWATVNTQKDLEELEKQADILKETREMRGM